MRRYLTTTAIAGLLAAAMPAAAASLKVAPLTVNLTPPAQAAPITLQNTSDTKISVQIRVLEWTQVNGENHYAETHDVVASPPASEIPPGASYTVRVARVAKSPIKGEKSYRLWVDELPPTAPPGPEESQVGLRIRYDLPVFFHEANAAPKLTWRAFRSGRDVIVEATNSGAGHARVENLKVSAGQADIVFGSGLNGYVLPGATYRWTAATPGAAPSVGSQAALSAGVGGDAIHEVVSVAAP
jgi:fimbrial chaperone protein